MCFGKSLVGCKSTTGEGVLFGGGGGGAISGSGGTDFCTSSVCSLIGVEDPVSGKVNGRFLANDGKDPGDGTWSV